MIVLDTTGGDVCNVAVVDVLLLWYYSITAFIVCSNVRVLQQGVSDSSAVSMVDTLYGMKQSQFISLYRSILSLSSHTTIEREQERPRLNSLQ